MEGDKKFFTEKTPAELRADFIQEWGNYYHGSFPLAEEGQATKDATSEISAYEVVFDALDTGERHHLVQRFALQATAAGFGIAATIVTPNVGFLENGRALSSMTYILNSPKQA